MESQHRELNEWALYKSWAYSVTVDRENGVTIVQADGGSQYLQGDDSNTLQNDVQKLEDKWGENDGKRVEFTDHLLSQYF